MGKASIAAVLLALAAVSLVVAGTSAMGVPTTALPADSATPNGGETVALRGDRLAVKHGTAAGTHHVTVRHRSVVRTRHAASRHRIVTARTRFAAGRHYTVAVRTRHAAVRHRGVAARTRVAARSRVAARPQATVTRHAVAVASTGVVRPVRPWLPQAPLWRRHRRRHAGQRHGRQRGADLAVLRRVLVLGQSLQDRGLLGLLPVVDRITRLAPPV